MVVKESLNNIVKHANASQVYIATQLTDKYLSITIQDNGIGFDTSVTSKGIGLQNMQARVKSLNGKFSISSNTQASTAINIAIPIK